MLPFILFFFLAQFRDLRHLYFFHISDISQPRLHITPARDIIRGDDVVFQCISNGTGVLNYTWYKDGKLLTAATNLIMTILNIDVDFSAVYNCSVSNTVIRKMSNRITVDVLCKYEFSSN